MNILTLYVGQGALVMVCAGQEVVFVDSYLPATDAQLRKNIQRQVELMMRDRVASGLILTGFDADHSCPDGVEWILSQYEPRWVMYPKYYKDTDSAGQVFQIIGRHVEKRRTSSNPLHRHSVRVDRVDSRILTIPSEMLQFELFSPHCEDMDNSNNSSIVLKMTGVSGFSYLITGDTENERWERIGSIFKTALKSDILAAPHHGSKDACHPETLQLIDPDTILISAGVDNQYDHPDSQTIRVYERLCRQVFATNIEGGVSLYTKQDETGFSTSLVR